MKKIPRLLVMVLLLTSVGCSNLTGDNSSGSNNPPALKPLPECASNLPLILNWAAADDAFSYTFEIGFSENNYFESRGLSEKSTNLVYSLDTRGVWYFVSLKKSDLNGQTTTRTAKVYVPTCTSREAWQKSNPKYSEPIEINLIF
jgi:hypothetical protein